MLQRGVYFHPDGMERIIISATHDELDVESVLAAAEESLFENFPELSGISKTTYTA
jgi:glutamate-1-semialdehyde aminotransferase